VDVVIGDGAGNRIDEGASVTHPNCPSEKPGTLLDSEQVAALRGAATTN
jgi:hypothetical protein